MSDGPDRRGGEGGGTGRIRGGEDGAELGCEREILVSLLWTWAREVEVVGPVDLMRARHGVLALGSCLGENVGEIGDDIGRDIDKQIGEDVDEGRSEGRGYDSKGRGKPKRKLDMNGSSPTSDTGFMFRSAEPGLARNIASPSTSESASDCASTVDPDTDVSSSSRLASFLEAVAEADSSVSDQLSDPESSSRDGAG